MRFALIALAVSYPFAAQAHTIADKKASFERSESELDHTSQEQLALVNEALAEKRLILRNLYEKVRILYQAHSDPESYQALIEQIKGIRGEIGQIEELWREEMSSLLSHDDYALWHQPDTSLFQLVMDYGAGEYVYLVPPDIGSIRLSMHSNLPIPKESWRECLELILAGHGVGIREVNPYLRELYLLKQRPSHLKCITSSQEELDTLPPKARICYVLSVDSPNPRSSLQFLQKFSNPASTTVQLISGQIFLISDVESIKELLKLHEFVAGATTTQDFQLVTLSKIVPREMIAILESAFQLGGSNEESSSLKAIPLAGLNQSLFLSGYKEEVSKALKLIRDVEAQVEDPQEKTVFWYTAKHSDAEDLATVLARVYDLLTGGKKALSDSDIAKLAGEAKGKGESSGLVVKPASIAPSTSRTSHRTADGQNNFIVDPKTGSIIMVVEQDALPKIKELLKKLDVPKKMVQIDVLLFEKKVSNQSKIGLNLLKLGDSASKKNSEGLSWNSVGKGMLEFMINRAGGGGIPAYDLAFNFLLGQDNVQINASPSVTTVNQTPATIAIVEEISINTGTAVDAKRDSYTRAQYGITIQITPTINVGDDLNESCITLDTDITFDTTKKGHDERPDVTRRHIKNHVRIPDGQTVILGGLRRKNSEDSKDSIPFLGEIPGIGKLFSTTEMDDNSTEMFVFITPRIIADPSEEAERVKREELTKRPGDVPEFLHELVESRQREKKRLFEGSMSALFGRKETLPTRERPQEYDGR